MKKCAIGPWILSSEEAPPKDGTLIVGKWYGYYRLARWTKRPFTDSGIFWWIEESEADYHYISDDEPFVYAVVNEYNENV